MSPRVQKVRMWERAVRAFRTVVAMMCLVLASIGSARALAIGDPVQISSLPDIENQPDIAVSGDVAVAVWMSVHGGCSSGAVWALSGDGGVSWGPQAALPNEIPDVRRGQPTICSDGTGDFYAARMSCYPGYTIDVMHGKYDGVTVLWQPPVVAVAEPYDSIEQDLPRIACDPGGSFVYLSYTNDYQQVFFICSTDSGVTWSVPVALSPPTCTGSRPVVGPDGELYVIWQNFAALQIMGRKSIDHGASFGPPFLVADVRDNVPPLLSWQANTDRSHCCAAGFLSLAVDRTNSPRRGALYVTWTEHATGSMGPISGSVGEVEPNYYYALATPFQVGQTVNGYEASADDPPYTGDCDIFTFEATAGTTLWITGTLSTSSHSFSPPESWSYGLGCAGDTLHGAFTHGLLQVSGAAPPLIFTVPETGRYYLNISCSMSASAAYSLSVQTLEVSPTSVAKDHRDVMLVSSTNGGQTWSSRVRVNDDSPRFDNSLPEVAVDGLGTVHVAWYDRRDAPECGQQVHTYWAYSTDGGQTFQRSQRLSTTTQDLRNLVNQGWRVGDHLALAGASDRVYVLWTQMTAAPGVADDANIYGAVISDIVTGAVVTQLEADVGEGEIAIKWSLAAPSQFTTVVLQRAERDAGPWLPIVADQTDQGGLTVALDRTVEAGQTYWYRLVGSTRSGSQSVFGPVKGTSASPKQFELAGAWPNPTTGGLKAEFAVPREANVRLSVVDLQGREVTVLAGGTYAPGRYQVSWDGRARAGPLPAGLYFVRFRTPDRSLVSRVVISP